MILFVISFMKETNNSSVFNLSQKRCINCTRQLNELIRSLGRDVTPEEYSTFNLEHAGKCFRNCKHSTKAGEYHEAELAGKELLIEKSGQPRRNGAFISEVVTDNDTKAAKKIIKTQDPE